MGGLRVFDSLRAEDLSVIIGIWFVSLKNCESVGAPNIFKARPDKTIIPPARNREEIMTTCMAQNLQSDSTKDIGLYLYSRLGESVQ